MIKWTFTLVEIFMYHILNDQMIIHSCRDIYVPYSEWSNEHYHILNDNEHSLLYLCTIFWMIKWSFTLVEIFMYHILNDQMTLVEIFIHILNDQMNIQRYLCTIFWMIKWTFTLVEIFMYHILNDQMIIHSCRDIYVPYSEWSNEHSLL